MSALIERLHQVVGPGACLSRPEELFVYECDGLTLNGSLPSAVVLPDSTEQVAAAVRACVETATSPCRETPHPRSLASAVGGG